MPSSLQEAQRESSSSSSLSLVKHVEKVENNDNGVNLEESERRLQIANDLMTFQHDINQKELQILEQQSAHFKQVVSYKKELETLRQSLSSKDAYCCNLVLENQNLKAELQHVVYKLKKNHPSALRQIQVKHFEESQKALLESNIKDLSQKLLAQEEKTSQLCVLNEKLQEANYKLLNTLRHAKTKLNDTTRSDSNDVLLQDFQEKFRLLEKENARLTLKIKNKQADMKNISCENSRLITELSTLKDESLKTRCEVEGLESTVKRLQNELCEKDRIIDNMIVDLNNAEASSRVIIGPRNNNNNNELLQSVIQIAATANSIEKVLASRNSSHHTSLLDKVLTDTSNNSSFTDNHSHIKNIIHQLKASIEYSHNAIMKVAGNRNNNNENAKPSDDDCHIQ